MKNAIKDHLIGRVSEANMHEAYSERMLFENQALGTRLYNDSGAYASELRSQPGGSRCGDSGDLRVMPHGHVHFECTIR